MTKNKENKQQQKKEHKESTDWSQAKVEDIVKRLNKIEAENAELKKFLGLLEDRFIKLETGKELQAIKPAMSFNEFVTRLARVEEENARLRTMLEGLESRISALECKLTQQIPGVGQVAIEPGKKAESSEPAKKASAQTQPAKKDNDFDLFAEDDKDSAEKTKILEERLHAYQALKATKPKMIAKSSLLLDVKVWDDTTDIAALEKAVRDIQMQGLVWGQAKQVPVAYGVKKLQISCVIEDDKVSTEALEEKIIALEDYVQSVDIAAFNKI